MKAVMMALALLAFYVREADALALPTTVTDGVGLVFNSTLGDEVADFNLFQPTGGKFIREDIYWDIVQPTWGGAYNWNMYDNLASLCASHGMHRMLTLNTDGQEPNCAPPGPGGWSDWVTQFTNYASAVATHYAGQDNIYEIWNEPRYNSVLSDPVKYVQLVQSAATAMKAADPTCKILGPSLNDVDIQTGTVAAMDGYIAAGLLSYVDAISVHCYSPPGGPEQMVAGLNAVRSKIGSTMPIVATEGGYTTGYTGGNTNSSVPNAQVQGDYLARMFLVNFSEGIPFTTAFEWKDTSSDPNDCEGNFGMVTIGGVPKPAYYEMQLLTHSLKGETFTTKLSDRHTSDWLLVFTSPSGQQTLAAWTTGNPRTVTVSGWGTLQLTSTPFYANPTLLPGDANLDGRVDVLDLAILAANYRKPVTGGWMQADFNHDGVVDVADLALLAANYRHSYASDVVPDYNGLDAEAIKLLSLAGLTVAPEPGALMLLGTGLLGVFVYTWRRWK